MKDTKSSYRKTRDKLYEKIHFSHKSAKDEKCSIYVEEKPE